jgi:uncharacterized protein YbaA (DUF1428 family)
MPRYVDGFVIPIPKKNLDAYRRMSRAAGKVWVEHGALEYIESVGDDMNMKFGVPFPKLADAKRGETVVFSWIVYKSRAHRDRVNKKVMADERITKTMKDKKMPFDVNRMSYGGFQAIVDM